jgi:hypothetical protein
MKSPGYGQSGWDTASNALQGGVQTLERLRERDRLVALAAQERAKKDAQQEVVNTRENRQVANQERGTTASIEQSKTAGDRADKALAETTRHNTASEANDRIRAEADKNKADKYNTGGGRTPTEIEKINRLKKYYIEKEGMDEVSADKRAIDYVATAKGKSPRQLVIEAFQKKVQTWMENQFDPTATPTPEQVKQFKEDAISEVLAEEAGREITDQRGAIDRPDTAVPSPGSTAVPPVQGQKDPLIERNIAVWVQGKGTPQQIRKMLLARKVDPKLYGY